MRAMHCARVLQQVRTTNDAECCMNGMNGKMFKQHATILLQVSLTKLHADFSKEMGDTMRNIGLNALHMSLRSRMSAATLWMSLEQVHCAQRAVNLARQGLSATALLPGRSPAQLAELREQEVLHLASLLQSQAALLRGLLEAEHAAVFAAETTVLIETVDNAAVEVTMCHRNLLACQVSLRQKLFIEPRLFAAADEQAESVIADVCGRISAMSVSPALQPVWTAFASNFAAAAKLDPSLAAEAAAFGPCSVSLPNFSDLRAVLRATDVCGELPHASDVHWLQGAAGIAENAAQQLLDAAFEASSEEDVAALHEFAAEAESGIVSLLEVSARYSKAMSKLALIVTAIFSTLATAGFCRQEGDEGGKSRGVRTRCVA